MKIAVLFAGRIKNFEKCYETHYTHIFKNNDIDVYLAHNSKNNSDNLELFKKTYNVISIKTLTVDTEEYNRYPIPNGIGVFGRNCIIMFKCINEAFKMIDNKYDVILYMRADQHIQTTLNISHTLKEDTVYIPDCNDYAGGINDQFAYGTYASMKKYSSTIENLHLFLSENRVIFHPESINKYNIIYNKLNMVRIPLLYNLIKS